MATITAPSQIGIDNTISSALPAFDKLTRYKGILGLFLHFFGQTEKVWDSNANRHFYYSRRGLAKAITGDNHIGYFQARKITEKFMEIAHPFNKNPLKIEDFKTAYNRIVPAGTFQGALQHLEAQKQVYSPYKQFFYAKNLTELEDQLQEGDIIIKKIHEDNATIVTKAQGFPLFRTNQYREAYKSGHVAIYLGKINGESWIGEATVPEGNDPDIRRVKLSDTRCDLLDKNQYVIIRNKDTAVAKEAARLTKLWTLKLEPKSPAESKPANKFTSFKYNYFQAARSLWHSKSFNWIAKNRQMKFYADYYNAVPFQRSGLKRMFYCSQFVLFAHQMAELRQSAEFKKLIAENPPPKSHENEHRSGWFVGCAKISYSMRKSLWALSFTRKNADLMDKLVKTKVDVLRASPQDAMAYLASSENYEVVGMINKEQNRYSL